MNNFKYFFVLGLIGTFLSFNTLYACEVIATFQTECEDINPTLAEDEFQIRVQITQGDTNTISIAETTSQGVVFIDQGNGEWLSNAIAEINTIDIHLTDVNDCSGGFDITGIQKQCSCPTVATLTATTPTEICDDGSSTVTLELSTQGGAGDYTFSIENSMGITVESEANHSTFPYTFNVNADETYSIKSFYDNGEGCEAEKIGVVDVTVHPLPTATLQATGAVNICAGDASDDFEISFTGSAPFNYEYAINGAGQGILVEASTTATIVGATSGPLTYSLRALEDANGCVGTVSGTIAVTEEIRPEANISMVGRDICFGDIAPTIIVTFTSGTSPFNFIYDDGVNPEQSVSSINATTYSIPGATAVGDYSYILTELSDANCPAIASSITGFASYEVHSLPTFTSINATAETVCSDGSDPVTMFVTFTGQAPIGYLYTTGLGTASFETGGISLSTEHTSDQSGIHTFTDITDANGCMAINSGSFTIAHSNPLVLAVSISDNTECTKTLTATGNGTNPITWSNGETTNQIVLSNTSQSGTYTVTADDGICPPSSTQVTSQNIQIEEGPTVQISDNEETQFYNLGESISFNATVSESTTSFSWSGDEGLNGLVDVNSLNPSFTPIENGVYVYRLTASNGTCTNDEIIRINVGAVGLLETHGKNPLTIYPNPIEPNQTIGIDHDGTGTLSIFSAEGLLLLESAYNGSETRVNAPAQSGLFLIKFIDQNGQIFTAPLVIE